MDKDILRPTPQIWDAVAEDYTIELADSDRELASEIMRIFQKNGIKPGARLLELGSGSGHLSACMAQCGYNVTLLDFSAKALEKSRQTFEKYGLEGKFIQGDLLDLSDLSDQYDLMWNSGVMEHFSEEDFVGILRSVRGASHGAPFLFVVPNPESRAYLMMRFNQYSQDSWSYGKEYVRRDYKKLCADDGFVIEDMSYCSKDIAKWLFTSTFTGTEKSGIYPSMMDAGLFPDSEQYLIAYLLKENSVGKDGAAIGESVVTREPDYYYENLLELNARLFGARQERDKARQETETLSERIDRQEQDKAELEHQYVVVQDEWRYLKQRVAELETVDDKLTEARAELASKNTELAETQNALQISQSELAAAEEELEQLRGREQELRVKLDGAEQQIHTALLRLYDMIGAKQIRLIHFLNRWKYQGCSADRAERKKFRKWLFSRFHHAPDNDHRFHPLFPVIHLLETASTVNTDMCITKVGQARPQTPQKAAQLTLPVDPQREQLLAQPYTKLDVIVLSIIDYSFRHQRPQHFAQRLAQKGHRVFYVNANFKEKYSQIPLEENLWEVTLEQEKFAAIYASDWSENFPALQKQLDRLLHENAIRDAVVIVDYPNWVYGALYLREKYGLCMVTDYMDDFTGFLNPAEALVRKNCELLLRESDSVMASSQFLYDIAAKYADHVAMNRNGTEFNYFHQAWQGEPEKKKRPVIGYYGAIAEWFNADIVCRCAQRFPDCDIVLVGNMTAHREQLEQYKNIRLIGEVPYAKLLPWLSSFDVCLIPFDASTDLIKATNPVKFYEYLSAGKKIVATEIPELMPYRDQFAYLENDPEKFCDAVETCLKQTDTLASLEECFAFAEENDWDARAQVFEQEALAVYPKISIIVLCYNQLEYTKKCVESVVNMTAYPNYELILVDNHSTDDTADYLKEVAETYENVKIVLNETNRGFAGGNNDGIAVADGEYLVLLNNDTMVTRGWLTGLLKHFRSDVPVGLVGPVTNSIGNEARINVSYTDIAQMPAFAEAYTFRHMGEEYPHHGILAMFCLMISRELYDKVGPLDEKYGIGMFEDDDYSIASEKQGYRNILAEDVFIHHFGSVSFKKLEDATYRKTFDQNRTYYEGKWNAPWRKPFYRPGVQ